MIKCLATFPALALAVVVTACTVHQSDSAPPLTGPSDFAQSISITSNPDRLTQDGQSQSAIAIRVFDATGSPSSGVPIRLDMLVDGTVVDFGTLSARNVVSLSDGRATAVYTAAPAPPPASQVSNTVTIRAIAVGTNAQASNSFSTDIRLVPPGVILPPAGTPTANFTVSPTPASSNVPLNFDASSSLPGTNATLVAYRWTFGDGSSASGRTVSKTFTAPGTFNVTLTVTNDRSISASTTQAVTVGTTTLPTAVFTFSPAAPSINQAVNFNAAGSIAAPGRSIAGYAWDFGDGSAAKTGVTAQHDFGTVGTYVVTLVVTDDVAQKSTATNSVTVTAGAGGTPPPPTPPTPAFTFSPAAPGIDEIVFFNASTSSASAGRTIAAYTWTFGDGISATSPSPTATNHRYRTAGTYSVQLTVTDNGVPPLSATSPPTPIAVGNPPAPTANFTFSPASPGRNDEVVFDASSSTTAQGQTIIDVAWNFGDGTAVIHCPGHPSCITTNGTNRISAHTFTTNETFIVNLVVTDSAGRTGSRNTAVAVALAQPNVVISTSPASPLPGATVQLNSNGTTYFPGSGPASFAWTFGDGGSSTLANPTHSYAAVGSYSVGLSVTDTKGRTGTGTATVTVAAAVPPTPPVARFTFGPPSPTAAVTNVTFDGNGSTGSSLTYTWNFGDGPPVVAGAVVNHVYASPGPYQVTLRVTDGITGLSNTAAAQTVTVVP